MDLFLSLRRCLYHDLIHLIRFRQKVILREIYLHIYPITIENKTELSIGNLKLLPAEDKSYLTSNSSFDLRMLIEENMDI